MIWEKIKFVLIPRKGEFGKSGVKSLRNWDLWGPMLFGLGLVFILGLSSKQGSEYLFMVVFSTIVGGSSLITLNTNVLGGNAKFF